MIYQDETIQSSFYFFNYYKLTALSILNREKKYVNDVDKQLRHKPFLFLDSKKYDSLIWCFYDKKHNVNEQLSEQNNRLIILFHNDYVGNENTLFSFFKKETTLFII